MQFGTRASTVDDALFPLGYVRAPERLYRHPDVLYTVEFPAGPLAIGSETITTYATEHRGDLLLHVYTPTDVVRDRFMHYWVWGDQGALRVALDVAAAQAARIDVPSIVEWTDREMLGAPVYDRARRDHFVSELGRVLA